MEEKRVMVVNEVKGLQIGDFVLIAVLIAAGAVLRLFAGGFINIFGMKPNFTIAMYCLAILLTKPSIKESAIIGLITGVVCQLLPGTPYLGLISEPLGAMCMAVMITLPIKKGMAMAGTFVSTVVSGGVFTILLFVFTHAVISSLAAYVPIVLCSAVINCIIVQVLYIPLKKMLKK